MKKEKIMGQKLMGQSGPQWIWSGICELFFQGRRGEDHAKNPSRMALKRGYGLEMLVGNKRAAVCSHNREKPDIILNSFQAKSF